MKPQNWKRRARSYRGKGQKMPDLTTDVNCPRCKAGGILFDVTTPIAAATGVKQCKCDRCGLELSQRIYTTEEIRECQGA